MCSWKWSAVIEGWRFVNPSAFWAHGGQRTTEEQEEEAVRGAREAQEVADLSKTAGRASR